MPEQDLSPCCEAPMVETRISTDLVKRVCACGRRHFELSVDPFKVGIALTSVG